MRRESSRRVVLVVVLLALIMAACSGGDSDRAPSFEEVASSLGGDGDGGTNFSRSTATTPTDAGEATGAEEVDRAATELGEGGITPVALPTNIGRDIIFTADLVVAVDDVAAAGERATAEIQRLGGFLFGQRTVGAPEPVSILTFKIDPNQFQAALTALGEIGELRSQDVSASDVTERIVDLESRIATATASVDRLRSLLSDATDVEAIVELEAELLKRETELETLRGSLRTLEDQVALATIVVSLTEAESSPDLAVTVSAYPTHDSGFSCPGGDETSVETGAEATVCYELINRGDTWLAEFELRDPVLDLEIDDLLVVFGDLSVPLEPGASLLLAYEATPERDLRLQTTVTAQPVSEDGSPLSARAESRTVSTFISAVAPDGIPTFADGLAASWELLVSLGQGALLVVGALIPFFWLPLAAFLAWRYLGRRREPAKSA